MMWNSRYSEPGYAYGTTPNDHLAANAHRIPDGPVLCLAGGEGRNAVFLAELGHEVTSVDLSDVGLRKTRQLAADRGVTVHTIQADLAGFDLPRDHWAGIISIFAHMPPPVRSRLHRQIAGALRPEGVFLLEAYTPQQLGRGTGGPPAAAMMMDLPTLHDELVGLRLIHGEEGEREIREGRYHRGLSHTVRLVATR